MESYFYNCSKEYIKTLSSELFTEITDSVAKLPKRSTQKEINDDLVWLLSARGWSFDTISGDSQSPSSDLEMAPIFRKDILQRNDRSLCRTATTIEASWHSDFAKRYPSGVVQIEAQFGKVESMFKDFCGFRIAWYERRIALGIEIVMVNPAVYFSHRKASIGGMAYFDIARKTLPAIGIECPIWLIGIE